MHFHRAGRGGEDSSQPVFTLCVYSASRKQRAGGQALRIVLGSNSWRHKILSRNNCWKQRGTHDILTRYLPPGARLPSLGQATVSTAWGGAEIEAGGLRVECDPDSDLTHWLFGLGHVR